MRQEVMTYRRRDDPPQHRKRVLIVVGTAERRTVVQGGWDDRTGTWRDMDGDPLPMAAVLGWSEWPTGSGL